MTFYESWTIDQLTRSLTLSKWVLGISGVVFAFVGVANQWITDRIAILQKADKSIIQERLKLSEQELEATKAKTVELEKKIAPRHITTEQKNSFVTFLTGAPTGKVAVAYVSPQADSVEFAEEVRLLLKAAGYDAGDKAEYEVGITAPARPPWFLSIIVNNGGQPVFTGPIQRAFNHIGIDAIGIDGLGNPPVGQIKIYIGNR